MDRKIYLELCQKNSVYPNSEKVNYKGAEYYPKALKVWFDNKGMPQNTAVIEDINSNSMTYCKLSEVRYEN